MGDFYAALPPEMQLIFAENHSFIPATPDMPAPEVQEAAGTPPTAAAAKGSFYSTIPHVATEPEVLLLAILVELGEVRVGADKFIIDVESDGARVAALDVWRPSRPPSLRIAVRAATRPCQPRP